MGKSGDSAAADCGCCCVGIADGRVPDSAFLGYILPWLRYDTGVCRTAAVNVGDYTAFFKKCRENYDAVIHFNISSDFSSCYQNACTAAAEFENVYVVDSRNLSTGLSLIHI